MSDDTTKQPIPHSERNYATMKHAMRKEFGVREEEKVPQEPGEVERAEKGKWKKGQSGNPKGRPKRVLPNGNDFKELFKSRQAKVIEKLWKLIEDPKTPAHVRMAAINEWNDRGLGKATQKVEVESTVNQSFPQLDMSGVSTDALRQLAKVASQADSIDGEIIQPKLPGPDGDE